MSDLATEIPAYGALVVAIGTAIWSELRFRSIRKARRAAGPTTDIRGALEAARWDFDDIVSIGGASTDFFLDEKRKGSEQHLHDLSGRTDDHSLSVALLEVSIAWSNAWAYASPPRPPTVYDLNDVAASFTTPAEVERHRKNELQVDIAREARDKCQAAIARLNELERDVAP